MPGVVGVMLEIGKARTFASALNWPGWCRSAKTETAALEALLTFAPRHGMVVKGVSPRLTVPGPNATVEIVERLPGNASTEFGAAGVRARRSASS